MLRIYFFFLFKLSENIPLVGNLESVAHVENDDVHEYTDKTSNIFEKCFSNLVLFWKSEKSPCVDIAKLTCCYFKRNT